MFIPGGCFCCEPPEDPCTLSGCTWSSTDMSDTDLTDGVAYHNAVSGTTPDGTYEITSIQETGTGNDAPCRKIAISTTTAPQKPDTVYAICWKDNATHNPATQCPLTSVSFCVESKRHGDSDSGLTDSVVFVVRQGGKVYATATQSVGVNWKRASGVYTSGQFNWINGTGTPDFTASGTSIEFGFALKLKVGEDDEPVDVVILDNLCVKKNCQSSCGCGCLLAITVSGITVSGTTYGNSDFPEDAIEFYNNILGSVNVVSGPNYGCYWVSNYNYTPINHSYFLAAFVQFYCRRLDTGAVWVEVKAGFHIPGSFHSWSMYFENGFFTSECLITNPVYTHTYSGGSYPYIAMNLSSPAVVVECA